MAFRVVFLLGVLASYHGFNLDVEEPMVFQEDAAGFGQSVVQFGASRLVVGAPLEVAATNQTGRLYDCTSAAGTCQPISLHIPSEAVNMSLGLTLAVSSNGSWLLTCGPTVHKACGENTYVKGSCFLMDSHLQVIRTVPAALPECPVQEMDIVFLIDGSGSIDQSDFNRMKDFVRAVMGQFKGTDTLFSLMQYSNLLETHFTFTKFRTSSSPQSLVDPVVQHKGLTFTATGILRVVKELFHSKNGARKSAKKILIVITDGQKYKDPLEYSDVIPQAERAGVIRYAIGVGDAFQEPSAKQELNTIGSEPPQDHVFKVDNFAALGSIQKQLQEKIFAIEGTQSRTSSDFQHEMAQEGFSSVLRKDGPVLGAVGSFGWSGGAFLYHPNKNPTFLNMSEERVDMRDSYLGYSTELALWKGEQNLVLGAPRYQHTGKVVIFTPGPKQWRLKAEVTGTQIGSYFGASLCSMDVNRDGNTDLVLIGAPHFYEQTQGGRVSRVAGSQLSPRLQYFGQSLSGGQDLTKDGLVDLAVGAQGHVLLLRSLPVLKVGVALSFTPGELAKAVYQCWEETPTVREAGNATVCLTIHKSSLDQIGDIQSSVTYDLALDPGRLISRAIFDETKNWTLTRQQTLGLGHHCETMRLLLPVCVEDIVSPIILRLNFSLVGEPIPSTQNLRPVLAVGSQDFFTASLPFEKNCGHDHLCEADLSVNFSFSGLQTLMVGNSLELNVTVTVWNEGEDSYETAITFYYPAGLSYRRVSGTQKQPHQHPLHLVCETVPTENESLRSSQCSINHPIFREGTKGTFTVTFDVSYKATLGNRLLMRANASSENNKPATSKTTFQLELPVKYAVYTVISRQEESTKFLNFSTSDEDGKEAEHRYRSLPCVSERELPQHPDFLTQIQRSTVLDCSIAACLRLRCDIPSFGVQEELDFVLKGNLSFGWVSQTLQKKVSLVSVAEITFDRSVYAQLPGQEAFLRAQTETVLEEYEVHNPIPLIVGSSVGGLLLLALITATLYKASVFIQLATPQLGFFRRQYKEMLDDKPEDHAVLSGKGVSCEAPDSPSCE
ncbi:Integrin alpha-D [Tupaia chinensis]|uniref:Integrin alpha-D n=1 Tax=Tupaia chinensis TaxID=246437 RepID=L9KTQ3_TUPCH|nr:Integrin alpha-D [Tupaia chinensis]